MAYAFKFWTCYALRYEYETIAAMRLHFVAFERRRPDQFTPLFHSKVGGVLLCVHKHNSPEIQRCGSQGGLQSHVTYIGIIWSLLMFHSPLGGLLFLSLSSSSHSSS